MHKHTYCQHCRPQPTWARRRAPSPPGNLPPPDTSRPLGEKTAKASSNCQISESSSSWFFSSADQHWPTASTPQARVWIVSLFDDVGNASLVHREVCRHLVVWRVGCLFKILESVFLQTQVYTSLRWCKRVTAWPQCCRYGADIVLLSLSLSRNGLILLYTFRNISKKTKYQTVTINYLIWWLCILDFLSEV